MAQFANNIVVSGIVAKEATVLNFEKGTVSRFLFSIRRKEGEKYVSALIPVEAWRAKENAHLLNVIQKGARLTLEGSFRAEEWNDKQNVHHSRLIIECYKVHKTDAFKPEAEVTAQEQTKADKPKRSRAKKAA